MTNMSDFKELIPEFFDTSKSDFLINKKKINFGHKWDGSVVNDIQLPPWAKNSASTFIQILRSALESNYVSANINHWIDLIFGYKQRGEEAVKSDNLFYHLCYEGSINLSNVTDLAARHALEVQILEFGQIPKQIFTTPHPQKLIHAKLHAVSCSVESFAVELIKSFTSFKDSILSLFYSENILISTGKDGNIKCFNIKENTQIRNVQVSTYPISACARFLNSTHIICSSWNNSILIYSLDYGRICGEFEAHDDSITCLKGIENGIQKYIISGSQDCYVKIWQWRNDQAINKRTSLIDCLAVDDKINCLDATFQDQQIIILIGCTNGEVIMWDVSIHKHFELKVKKILKNDEECIQLRVHPNDSIDYILTIKTPQYNLIATGGLDDKNTCLKIWRILKKN
uniref:CSON005487 protein n=1 Tax=Culicoides sonorensis TaxID=179676 RepID=A0A336L658_CULSO